jgi:hypothetical protein
MTQIPYSSTMFSFFSSSSSHHPRAHAAITRHAAAVAMGPSRALTSHLRSYFFRCYDGTCTHPRATFLFDAALLLLAAVLVVIAVWFALMPEPISGVAISMHARPLLAAAPTPIRVVARSVDGLTHTNVRLRWHLPPGAQVLSAEPPLLADGTMFLGTVESGDEIAAHVVVRLFAMEHTEVPFGFSVQYDGDGVGRQGFFGLERRQIEGSALTADVPDAFRMPGVVPRGAVVPIRIENTTDTEMPFVHVGFRETWSHAESQIVLGDLASKEVRWIFVPVEATPAGAEGEAPPEEIWLEWTVGAASRDVSSNAWQSRIVAVESVPSVSGDVVADAEQPISLEWTDLPGETTVLAVHPPSSNEALRFIVSPSAPFMSLPAVAARAGGNHEWLVAPQLIDASGAAVLGSATIGASPMALPFSTQVRYTSTGGDQLGVGPEPPQIGLETRYWVFWTVGPLREAVRDLVVRTTLPPGVRATGNVTAADGGTVAADDRTVRWDLPLLGGDGGVAKPEATVGFEIQVTPTLRDLGSLLPLVGTSTAIARDLQTPLRFEAISAPQTSWLPEYIGERERGVVVE